jgi:hypothetical protein
MIDLKGVQVGDYAPDERSGWHVCKVDNPEERGFALCLRMDRGNDPPVLVGLWQVQMTVKRKCANDRALNPATTICYVIAEDEEGAIGQVADVPLGVCPDNQPTGRELIKSGEMTATAHRVPLVLRGWGTQTF